MDNTMKICLIIGAVLLVLGLIVFAIVMTIHHWDFSRLSTDKYVTNTYSFSEAFTDISIQTDTADILFAPSDDDSCKVICREQENLLHSVDIQDGTLRIHEKDHRKWYEYMGISFGKTSITLYLPQSVYGALKLHSSTGDVTLPREFRFEQMDISISTGNIHVSSSVSETAKLRTTTGDIRVEGITAEILDLSASTGRITVSDVTCRGDMIVNLTTGKASVTDVTCRGLTSKGTTGELFLTNTVATGAFSIERDTGDVRFDRCDAAEIVVKTSTGDVTGSLLSDKIFMTQTDTGKIDVPKTTTGGKCEITTDTGDIKLSIEP